MLAIILIVVGLLFMLMFYEDWLANRKIMYDSVYYAIPFDTFGILFGLALMIAGFGLAAYIYIKLDKFRD